MKTAALLLAIAIPLLLVANNWSEEVFTLDGVRYAVGWQIVEGPRAVNELSPCHTVDEPRRCAWIKVWTVPADETAEVFRANVGRSGAAGSGRTLLAAFFQPCKSAGCTKDSKAPWIFQALHPAK